jgi:ribonuclease P protein component
MRLVTLKRSVEFKRVRGGARVACPAFVIETKPRPTGEGAGRSDKAPRFGFTITKKIGGAVERNRIRRRLKEAVRGLQADLAKPDHNYVVVARRSALTDRFQDLEAALRNAVETLHRPRSEKPRSERSGGAKFGAASGKGPTGERKQVPLARGKREASPRAGRD